MKKQFLGIDFGSTTLKAVIMSEDGKVLHSIYQRTKPVKSAKVTCSGRCNGCGMCNMGAVKKTIDDFLDSANFKMQDMACTVVTGSQIVEDTRRFIDYDFKVSEVSAHVAGARHYHPECKAILDVGGQDSKAMIYNEDMQMWTSKMSGICAAGTGAFLDSVAVKLGIPVEEFAEKANYDSDLEFSSTCAVLSATSINKFKNRYPLGQVIGGACRAQARTIISGVGELLFNYKGDIIFQGGVAYNRAVAYYLKEITGNKIIIPEFHSVMGALGAAVIGRKYSTFKGNLITDEMPFEKNKFKSISIRAQHTRKEFFAKAKGPLVWRNLFFPTEILNAMGVKMLTLETYAALFARNQRKIKKYFDTAAYKGFSAETCSFLRVLEGTKLPKPDFAVSTSQPCQQGERIFHDLSRAYEFSDKFYSLPTPAYHDKNAVEIIAAGLEESVRRMEKALDIKLDHVRLVEACEFSNHAQAITAKCNDLRYKNPPLIRGGWAVYNSVLFSQLWGRKELIAMQQQFYDDLLAQQEAIGDRVKLEDTHRILWLHLPPFYDTRILDYIESECKAPIVFEEVNFVNWEPLDPSDPYRSLARKLLTVGFLDPALRVNYIRENSILGKFNGCILYNHGFGRCSLSDSCFVKHLREELKKVDLPLLLLDGDCMDPTIDPCSTFTKISAYVEALNDKKYGNIFGKVGDKPVAEQPKSNVIEFEKIYCENRKE